MIEMKRLLLASAITTSLISSANAYTTYNISSSVTDMQMWVFTLSVPAGSFALEFEGTAIDEDDDDKIDSAYMLMSGYGVFAVYIDGWYVGDFRILWNNYGGYTWGWGTTFHFGTVSTEVLTTSGWQPYSVIDASTTNLAFALGEPGHLGGTQTTAGLQLAPGTNPLPGLWDGDTIGIDNAVGVIPFLGIPTGVYLEGTITLSP
jgi:hypothetical protein